jgi:hypothetical protein
LSKQVTNKTSDFSISECTDFLKILARDADGLARAFERHSRESEPSSSDRHHLSRIASACRDFHSTFQLEISKLKAVS